MTGDCSDGNRLHLEEWPFCHIVTYSLAVIGTVTVVRIFLDVPLLFGHFEANFASKSDSDDI